MCPRGFVTTANGSREFLGVKKTPRRPDPEEFPGPAPNKEWPEGSRIDALLSDQELVELTGVEQSAAQLRVLRPHGIWPVVRRDGRPRVTRSAVSRAMLAKGTQYAEPDFSSLRRK
ncbi:DUF4224 domain-containing protein [Nevskia soli]|uniref:DUF4224 domain-containing protein n=1 Tax=Nevskia soli TaxID=418856 RepID=UPI00344D7F02